MKTAATVSKKLVAAPGLAFRLTDDGARRPVLKPFAGQVGQICQVRLDGILGVVFPTAHGVHYLAPGLGDILPATALSLAESAWQGQTAPDPAAPPRVLTIGLPLPPRECSPNWTGKPKDKWTAKAAYRETVADLCRVQLFTRVCVRPLRLPVKVDLAFYLFRARRPFFAPGGGLADPRSFYYPTDEDNARAAFKAGQDGIVDACIVPNDTAAHLTAGRTVLLWGDKSQGRTELILTLTEAGAKEGGYVG